MPHTQPPKKRDHAYRFEILAEWLSTHYPPGKVADIGGGKGLLSYFLIQQDWQPTVIDPEPTDYPKTHYRDKHTGKLVALDHEILKSIPVIAKKFSPALARDFDLLVGLHAHGSNRLIIDTAKESQIPFVLVPCCVIDEPIEKKPGINWFNSLVDYAKTQGLAVQTDQLPFYGKNFVLYASK